VLKANGWSVLFQQAVENLVDSQPEGPGGHMNSSTYPDCRSLGAWPKRCRCNTLESGEELALGGGKGQNFSSNPAVLHRKPIFTTKDTKEIGRLELKGVSYTRRLVRPATVIIKHQSSI
jgi:hypothetical protein